MAEKQKRVLVADPDPAVRRLIARSFEKAGYFVVESGSLGDMQRSISHRSYHAVVMNRLEAGAAGYAHQLSQTGLVVVWTEMELAAPEGTHHKPREANPSGTYFDELVADTSLLLRGR